MPRLQRTRLTVFLRLARLRFPVRKTFPRLEGVLKRGGVFLHVALRVHGMIEKEFLQLRVQAHGPRRDHLPRALRPAVLLEPAATEKDRAPWGRLRPFSQQILAGPVRLAAVNHGFQLRRHVREKDRRRDDKAVRRVERRADRAHVVVLVEDARASLLAVAAVLASADVQFVENQLGHLGVRRGLAAASDGAVQKLLRIAVTPGTTGDSDDLQSHALLPRESVALGLLKKRIPEAASQHGAPNKYCEAMRVQTFRGLDNPRHPLFQQPHTLS